MSWPQRPPNWQAARRASSSGPARRESPGPSRPPRHHRRRQARRRQSALPSPTSPPRWSGAPRRRGLPGRGPAGSPRRPTQRQEAAPCQSSADEAVRSYRRRCAPARPGGFVRAFQNERRKAPSGSRSPLEPSPPPGRRHGFGLHDAPSLARLRTSGPWRHPANRSRPHSPPPRGDLPGPRPERRFPR